MTALFTIIVDYSGGTYVSQVRADNEVKAALRWCDEFQLNFEIPEKVRPLALEVLNNLTGPYKDEIIPLNGVISVWCLSAVLKRKLAIINIIKTEV